MIERSEPQIPTVGDSVKKDVLKMSRIGHTSNCLADSLAKQGVYRVVHLFARIM